MFAMNTRILILDNMTTMRKIVARSLKEMGFTDVQEADDGDKGWKILKTSNPPIQLVVSDWKMPTLSGLDLLRAIRADQQLGRIPFVMLTAEAEMSQVREALKAGVTTYIIKPFTTETLRQHLEATHKKVTSQVPGLKA